MGNSTDSNDHPDRYRSEARRTASARNIPTLASNVESNGGILPTHNTPAKRQRSLEAGGLSSILGGVSPQPNPDHHNKGSTEDGGDYFDGPRDGGLGRDPEKSTHNDVEDSISHDAPPPAPPPLKSEDTRSGDTAIEPAEADGKKNKQPITTRMKNGSKRFYVHLKDAITHSWINVLLVAVPAGIAVEAAGLNPTVVFAINAVAIVPLAGLLTHATEAVASRLGDTLGALLNVSFGNAVELIIFIIALAKNEIRIVQASLLGSILANLLLILGMAFLLGGLRFREQIYNSTVTQMSACLLSLSVMSLLLPTAFHASFNDQSVHTADSSVLKVSRGTSVILLLVYFLYLLFQLKSHAYMYESTPQAIIDEESHPGVLADMMNSSSSSDSSSSSSSDSDTSDSGSVAATTKRVKRMFQNKKRRKSSASTSSAGTGAGKLSALSSPSTQEREDYLEHPVGSHGSSRRESALPPVPNYEDVDGDHEDNGTSRNFDWATHRTLSNDGSKPLEPPKRHKKHSKKKHRKHRHRKHEEDANEAVEADSKSASGAKGQPKVNFADDVAVNIVPTESQQSDVQPANAQSSRIPFNMRQFSSRARPGISKMFSNNVFVQPAPNAPLQPRPQLNRSQSSNNLRRTSSLPDRLNRSATPQRETQTFTRTDPLPPFQHQRFAPVRKVTSELSNTKDDGEEEGEEVMSRTAATVLLLCSTALVAVCAEFMVDAIPAMIGNGSSVSEAFIGLIILPIVGNAAEHVTAVTVAAKNKMDLAIGVAVGSSIQIALFVTPVVVLLGWCLDRTMSLYFNLFETVSLFVTVLVVNFLVLDGRSNYMEGALLMSAYVIIALVSFFYPDAQNQSSVGGGVG